MPSPRCYKRAARRASNQRGAASGAGGGGGTLGVPARSTPQKQGARLRFCAPSATPVFLSLAIPPSRVPSTLRTHRWRSLAHLYPPHGRDARPLESVSVQRQRHLHPRRHRLHPARQQLPVVRRHERRLHGEGVCGGVCGGCAECGRLERTPHAERARRQRAHEQRRRRLRGEARGRVVQDLAATVRPAPAASQLPSCFS
jgi:hypothetical protein